VDIGACCTKSLVFFPQEIMLCSFYCCFISSQDTSTYLCHSRLSLYYMYEHSEQRVSYSRHKSLEYGKFFLWMGERISAHQIIAPETLNAICSLNFGAWILKILYLSSPYAYSWVGNFFNLFQLVTILLSKISCTVFINNVNFFKRFRLLNN